jgi:hypothetical protein
MSARTAVAAIFATIGLIAGLVPGRASADLITAHITGIFAAGTIDTYGYFGTDGANLSGLAFNFFATYASSGSGITDSDTLSSESISSAGDPFEESLTVGGNTVTLTTVSAGLTSFALSQGAVNLKVSGIANVPTLRNIGIQFSSTTSYAEGLLDTQTGFNTVLSGIETPPGGGFFGFKLQGSGGGSSESLGIGSITGLSVAEPASLAIFAAGLLGLGCVRRRIPQKLICA